MANDIYTLSWYNSELHIAGPKNDKLEKAMSFMKKELIFNPKTYSRETRRSEVKVFDILRENNGIVVYRTFQGLINSLVNILKKQNNIPLIKDLRIPFPAPKLENMHGFRFNQKEKTEELLRADRSGIFHAPTRYGKSVVITNIINAFPDVKTVVLAPGVDLLPQLMDTIKKYCPERDVTGIFSGSKTQYMSNDITVCSMDSMHKLDKDSVKLVLIDEPHAVVTESRGYQLAEFHNARILGFGATIEGRFDNADKLIEGLIGPVLTSTTFSDCVKLGALCPIHAHLIKIPFKPVYAKQRNTAYNKLVFQNSNFHKIVGNLCNSIIPKDFQTLCFINNQKEAEALKPFINDSYIAMDKLFKNKKERQEIFKDLKEDKLKRVLCSNIYSTGVTIDNIRCVINCDGGGGSILSVQKPGRLAEIKPNKVAGYMIDFIFEPEEEYKESIKGFADEMVVRDCWSRYKTYKEKGYDIFIHNLDDINNLNLI